MKIQCRQRQGLEWKTEERRLPESVGTGPAYLKLEEISKKYGNHLAVAHVSMEIFEHEFVTLLGPSGSGKTTLLMALAGFVQPESGRIFLQGEDITREPPNLRGIGVVFQNYALFPHMSVFDNVAYPLKMRKTPRAKARVMIEEILDVVQLTGMEERRPLQLSGGQQQRVALARALVFKPGILLMDEPLSALDRKLREQMQLEIKRIQHQLGMTVVYVTHDQDEALTMSSRIAVLNRGRIEQMGTASDIYERPESRFVAEFVGETNFFELEVVSTQGGIVHLQGSCCPGARATARRSFQPGELVQLAVRPEKLFLPNGREPRGGALEAIVDEIIYLGEITKYLLKLPGDVHHGEPTIIMKVQNRHSAVKLNRGDCLRVGWDETDGLII